MTLTLADFLQNKLFLDHLSFSDEQKLELIETIEDRILPEFLEMVILESEAILSIDPNLASRKILELAAAKIVKNLNAEAASIRLLDSHTLKMLSFGSFGLEDFKRISNIPVSKSIAGLVAQRGSSIIVPSIKKDKLYQSKEIIATKGFQSLIAVPLLMPSFVKGEGDVLGSLQIYYREDDRKFSKIEVIMAEMLARRVSHVLAKKKILDLKKLNDSKEKITDKIFVKLSRKEGIKLKDFFHLIIPEIDEFLHIFNCSLFTMSEDLNYIQVEAAYPLDRTYYEPGYTFSVKNHPAFWTSIHGLKEYMDKPNERFHPNYLLIKNPNLSELTSSGFKAFAKEHNIHSILLVPLKVGDEPRHLLSFYAADQKQSFHENEIELLTFIGKEIMKASTLEFLGDALHDFKNPAIAVAGFAQRAMRVVKENGIETKKVEKLHRYLDIIAKESSRMQDIALTISNEGRKEIVDLGQISTRRFFLNQEVINQSHRKNIIVESSCQGGSFPVFCPLYSLERILDNMLSNATKAIPAEGGRLAMHCFLDEKMAGVTISNTGLIAVDQIEQIKKGNVQGRGLNIINRFVQANHGKLEISQSGDNTVFSIKLPLHQQ